METKMTESTSDTSRGLGIRSAVHLAYSADFTMIVPFGNEIEALRHAVANQMFYKRAAYGQNLLDSPSAPKPARKKRRSAAQVEADRMAAELPDPKPLVDQKALAAEIARLDAIDEQAATRRDAHTEALARNAQIKAEHAAADHVEQDVAAELGRDQ